MKFATGHYHYIADTISRLPDNFGYRTTVAKDFATAFSKMSQRFNKKKFLEACNANMEEAE